MYKPVYTGVKILFIDKMIKIQTIKSLILAQDERWRHA